MLPFLFFFVAWVPLRRPPALMAARACVRTPSTYLVATGPSTISSSGVLATDPAALANQLQTEKALPLRVMVAGGGIGGLCAALVLKNQGFDVSVFEKTETYKPFGGPIQIASNALESLLRIDAGVYKQIMSQATVIGDRKNGLKDGLSSEWFATFDLYSPAKARNQDVSVVIDRPKLQDILLSAIGDCVQTGAEVVGYEPSAANGRVIGILSDGTRHEADMLVGADGIWSKVRAVLDPNPKDPVWSGYTCFAAIANCVPDDIKEVGYKVYLGSRKYFVSVDVGGGRVQWYAFLNVPPKSLSLAPGDQLRWLKETQFNDWSPEVHQLLDSTPIEEVEQRDLYDRIPELRWASGRVCLLGDAAHPMMPNLDRGRARTGTGAASHWHPGGGAARAHQVQQQPRRAGCCRPRHVAPLERDPLPVQPPYGRGLRLAAADTQRRTAFPHHACMPGLPRTCRVSAAIRVPVLFPGKDARSAGLCSRHVW